MKFAQYIIADSLTTSADVTSDTVLLDQIFGYSAQCVFTGSPSGTVKIEVSCEIIQSGETVSDWDTLAGSETAIAASGIVTYNCDAQYYKYFRVVYERLSGSGTLKVTYNGKG